MRHSQPPANQSSLLSTRPFLWKTRSLILQALWQIYLPKHIPLPKFDVFTPNTKQTLFFFYTTLWGMVGPKKRVTPQRCRNAAARGPKIFRMGRLASCCGLFSERRSHSLTCKNPLRSSKKRPFIPSPPPLITDLFACARHDSPPRRLCAIFTSPASLRTKAKEATDPIWPFKVYHIVKTISKPDEPILDYLHHGPKRGFVCEELLVVPTDTELPPLHRWYSIGSVWMPSWQDLLFVVVGVQR